MTYRNSKGIFISEVEYLMQKQVDSYKSDINDHHTWDITDRANDIAIFTKAEYAENETTLVSACCTISALINKFPVSNYIKEA